MALLKNPTRNNGFIGRAVGRGTKDVFSSKKCSFHFKADNLEGKTCEKHTTYAFVVLFGYFLLTLSNHITMACSLWFKITLWDTIFFWNFVPNIIAANPRHISTILRILVKQPVSWKVSNVLYFRQTLTTTRATFFRMPGTRTLGARQAVGCQPTLI